MKTRLEHNNEQFEKVLQKLNTAQRYAVEELSRPVMVIAGPGTGKTQILAARIAHILQQGDVYHENILCLTYTDAGTIAMRKRLLSFIGPDAYRIPIHTFHAFCNLVIQENIELFGLRELDAVSELEQIQIVHEIIDGFAKGNPLKRYSGDIYFETNRLLALYDQMKRENLSPTYLIEKTDAYIQEMETLEAFVYKRDSKYGKKGDKNKAYYDELRRLQTAKAAIATFDSYNAALKRRGRYDFSDMIRWIVDAFQTNEDLLRTYQERYHYFLVDEYQDTSGSQNAILQMLISFWDMPNVFVVGDDDQSIYRFQGANVENIQSFKMKYDPFGLAQITLTENYRSSQQIIDAADALIRNNAGTRIDPNKQLTAKNELYATHEMPPRIWCFDNPAGETTMLAKAIQELITQGTPANEIAVLYKNHAQSEELIRFLNYLGINVNTRRRVDILHEPLIQNVLMLLRYIVSEFEQAHSGESDLYACLHLPGFGIKAIDIARLAVRKRMQSFDTKPISWREMIQSGFAQKHPEWYADIESPEPIHHASELFEKWIQQSVEEPLQNMIARVLQESRLIARVLRSAESSEQMQLLHSFYDFVKESSMRHPGMRLKAFVEMLELMQSEGVRLENERILFSGSGVQCITAHSSKGLEFDHVFLIGCNEKVWDKGSRNRGYTLPPNLSEQISDETDEARRLFYVAMTRARKGLYLCYAACDNKGKDLEKSRFVAEVESSGIHIEYIHTNPDMLIQLETCLLEPISSTAISLFENSLVDELLQNYSLSVTHLSSYLRCPTSFYFNNLLRVPSPKNAASTFGSAVHFALERLFKNMNADESKTFPDEQKFIHEFKWYMYRNRDQFTEAQWTLRMEQGDIILPAFYQKYISEWSKVTSVEKKYQNIVLGDIPLNGKLDKLEFKGNSVNVVDYKTGKFDAKKFKRPLDNLSELSIDEIEGLSYEDRYGGDYWRQAVFYKWLVDNDRSNPWEMISAEFDFVEPDKETGAFRKEKVVVQAADMTFLEAQIKQVYASIQARSFANGCNEPDCVWCQFRNNLSE